MPIKKFKKINVEISNICNLQCSFCPPVEREKKIMSVENFKVIIAKIKDSTELICLHLMGDPLTHPHLPSLIQICQDAQLPIFLVTNGHLLRPDREPALFHPILQQISFSLHSFFDNFPEQDPCSYLEKILAFSQKALALNPKLFINYRLWNLDQTQEHSAKNLQILKILENFYRCQIPPTLNLQEGKGVRLARHTILHFDTEFTWPSLTSSIFATEGTCHGLKSHIGILADGTVVPCCLDKEGVINLGNILNDDLGSILSSPRADKIRSSFAQGRLAEPLCQRCNYIERFQTSPTPSL